MWGVCIIKANLNANLRSEVEASKKALASAKASFGKRDKRRAKKIRNLASSKRSMAKQNMRLKASWQREQETSRIHLEAFRSERAKHNFMKKPDPNIHIDAFSMCRGRTDLRSNETLVI